jgi:steroid 5-alpha reductase family enzyme
MLNASTSALLQAASTVLLAALFAVAGSQGGARIAGVAVLTLCAIIAFAIQWVAFIPAYLRQTEHFFDLVGSLTHLSAVACALSLSANLDARALILAAMIIVWAVRLGAFLARRVRRDGFDRRFTLIKTDPARFFLYWTMQGLWVFMTLAAALAAITSTHREPLSWIAGIGIAMWCAGFAIEVVADRQKRAFRKAPENAGRFITSGLWAWSRHPNYFGEILLWLGVATIAAPALAGWQWATLISPLFVLLLLTKASGIPMLEDSADARWGSDPAYQAYKDRTPVLLMLPPKA